MDELSHHVTAIKPRPLQIGEIRYTMLSYIQTMTDMASCALVARNWAIDARGFLWYAVGDAIYGKPTTALSMPSSTPAITGSTLSQALEMNTKSTQSPSAWRWVQKSTTLQTVMERAHHVRRFYHNDGPYAPSFRSTNLLWLALACSFCSLTSIEIHYTIFTQSDTLALIEQNHRLQHLSLTCADMSIYPESCLSAARVADALRMAKDLQTLSLNYGEVSTLIEAQLVQQNPKLTRLNLEDQGLEGTMKEGQWSFRTTLEYYGRFLSAGCYPTQVAEMYAIHALSPLPEEDDDL